MKAKIAVLCAAIALGGCVSSGESVPGPSGQKSNSTKCSGSPNGCLKKAAEVCKGSYQVLDSSSNAGGLVADIIPGPVTWYRMSYQCGKTDGKFPQFPFRGSTFSTVYVPPTYTAPSTTSCNRFGNNVTCNTY